MTIAVVCNDAQKAALLEKGVAPGVQTVFVDSPGQMPADANIVFDCLFENELPGSPGSGRPAADSRVPRVEALAQWLPRPVIIHSVTATLGQIGRPFIRVNAWQGFLQHPILEITTLPGQEANARQVFEQLGWQYRLVPDIPGLVSARVIATIINEAWFTYGDGISTREEIDIAMKSGTSYPYGPFEWGGKIGLDHIGRLLAAMRAADSRYAIAPALEAAIASGK